MPNRFNHFFLISALLHVIFGLFFYWDFAYNGLILNEPLVDVVEILPIGESSNVKNQSPSEIEKKANVNDAKIVKRTSKNKDILTDSLIDNNKITEVPNQKEIIQKSDSEDNKQNDKDVPKTSTKDVVVDERAKILEKTKPLIEKKIDKKPVPDKKAGESSLQEKKKKEKKDDFLDDIMNDLEKKSDGMNKDAKKSSASFDSERGPESRGQYDSEKPLSISEKNLIKAKIERNWHIIGGDKSSFRAVLHIVLKEDGSISSLKIKDVKCEDKFFCQSMIDATERAVMASAPFSELDPRRYGFWKEFYMEFIPSF